jgi:hypothetical protein
MAYITPYSTLAENFQQLTKIVNRSLENDAMRAKTRCLRINLGFLPNAVYFVGKTAPLRAWAGTERSRSVRLPEFLDNRKLKVFRLSARKI